MTTDTGHLVAPKKITRIDARGSTYEVHEFEDGFEVFATVPKLIARFVDSVAVKLFVDALKGGQTQSPTDDPRISKLSAEVENLKDIIGGIEQDNARLKSENADLEAKLASADEEVVDLGEKVQTLEEHIASTENGGDEEAPGETETAKPEPQPEEVSAKSRGSGLPDKLAEFVDQNVMEQDPRKGMALKDIMERFKVGTEDAIVAMRQAHEMGKINYSPSGQRAYSIQPGQRRDDIMLNSSHASILDYLEKDAQRSFVDVSVDLISKSTGVTVKAVQRALETLEKEGCIGVIRQATPRKAGLYHVVPA